MTERNGTEAAVTVRGLVKHYGETKALDGVDLDVRQGTVLGVLGPNGAGKTTLVRVLSTLIRPDAGTAWVAGYDVLSQPRQLRRVIGLTGQYASVDEALSGAENLYMIGRLLDLSRKDARTRADELLERFSLTEDAKRPAKGYSGGMRRRLDLAASMIGRPSVLYLDEPTTGLDPRTRNEVWVEVKSMVAEGATVLLTTQYMEEAEQLVEIGRMMVATTILLIMGFILGLNIKTDVLHLLGAVGLALVFGAALTWISILLGLSVNSPQAVQGIGMLVLMPLQFGSSIFAKPTTMPGWLQSFTKVNPLSNLADASRALINGGAYAHSVWITLAWAAGITLITAPLAVARFRKKT